MIDAGIYNIVPLWGPREGHTYTARRRRHPFDGKQWALKCSCQREWKHARTWAECEKGASKHLARIERSDEPKAQPARRFAR